MMTASFLATAILDTMDADELRQVQKRVEVLICKRDADHLLPFLS